VSSRVPSCYSTPWILEVLEAAGSRPQIKPSQSGWETYRIVTRTTLRTTYQEDGIYFSEPPLL